jgi:CheY-like chemotaxis protein
VIFLTAKVQAADKRRYLDMGVSGVIAKPFDPLTLGRTICECLDWPVVA